MGGVPVLRAAAAAGLAVALTGCWEQPGFDAGRSHWNAGETAITSANAAQLGELWDTRIPNSGRINNPIATRGTVYVTEDGAAGLTDAYVAALNGRTGAIVWRSDVAELAGDGGFDARLQDPAYVDDTVLVPVAASGMNPTGTHARLDPTTGEIVDPGDGVPPFMRSVAVADGVVATTSAGQVNQTFLQAEINWKYRPVVTGSLLQEPRPGRAFAIAGDRILWSSGTQALGFSPACPPAFPGSDLCGPDWRTELGGYPSGGPDFSMHGPAVIGTDQGVYADDTGTVTVLDVTDGSILWTAELGAAIKRTPAVVGGTIFVATTDGRLVALPAAGCGAATCPPLWEASLGAPPTSDPAAGGDVVYVAAGTTLLAFGAGGCGSATCAPLTVLPVGAVVTGGPIVEQGRVIVGTVDGRVVAYGLG